MARPEPSLASAKWPGNGPRRSAMPLKDQGCSRDQARDLGFQVGAGEGGAGERNRIPTISLGIRQIRAADRPELGIRCTASDRESPSDTGVNGSSMARGLSTSQPSSDSASQRLSSYPGIVTLGGAVSLQENTGGNDQSLGSLKMTAPPEN